MKMYRSEPLTEKEKAYLRKVNGTKQRFAADMARPSVVKEREFIMPVTLRISKRTKRGFNGCKLDPRLRALVEQRSEARKEFFAGLGVKV